MICRPRFPRRTSNKLQNIDQFTNTYNTINCYINKRPVLYLQRRRTGIQVIITLHLCSQGTKLCIQYSRQMAKLTAEPNEPNFSLLPCKYRMSLPETIGRYNEFTSSSYTKSFYNILISRGLQRTFSPIFIETITPISIQMVCRLDGWLMAFPCIIKRRTG